MAQAPPTDNDDSAERLRRAGKRLLNAQRDFNKALAQFEADLAHRGIAFEVQSLDHGPHEGEGETK